MYIYINIYICVCVCVCVYIYPINKLVNKVLWWPFELCFAVYFEVVKCFFTKLLD